MWTGVLQGNCEFSSKFDMGNFVLAISMLKRSQNLKILVPTPQNTPIIMQGTKFKKGIFFASPFTCFIISD
jgi:hypothetical protein